MIDALPAREDHDFLMGDINKDAGDWAMVEAQLPPRWRELAVEYKVIRNVPSQLGAKINDAGTLLRLIFFQVGLSVSLKVACAAAAAAGIIDITAVALHLRMRKCGPYLAVLLAEMNKTTATFQPAQWAGYDIRIVDASVVTRPGAKGTTARVHYGLRLADLAQVEVVVTDEKVGETFRHFRFEPGQLVMGDRCYANPPGIRHVVSAGADVLVRYNFGSLPLYDSTGKRVDVEEQLQRLTAPLKVREWPVFVHAKGDNPISGRLVAIRLPPDLAEQARMRVRAELGPAVTEQSLRTAAFVVLFTTIPSSRMSAEQVMTLYSLRWQVELRIKRDKSITELDRLPNFRSDTIHAWLCAKLLTQQIALRISTPKVAFPPSAISCAAIPGAHLGVA
jgi:hypothetical protein